MIFDMGLNICATGIPIAILQLIIYPYISRNVPADSYGLMITLYSGWMVISNSFGNVINNIRLLYANEYEEKHLTGDFNIILRKWFAVELVIVSFITIYYTDEFSIPALLLSLAISGFVYLKAYIEVGFRISLNYRAIFVNGLLQGCGFLAGAYLFHITGIWQWVFFFGYLVSMLYSVLRTGLLAEPLKKTYMYHTVSKSCVQYMIATFSASLMSYADKMVIYPLMGGHAVSVYYTATILGKIVSMLTGPITSVILSYISKWNKKNRNVFSKVLPVAFCLALLGYFITLFISRPVISILFPQWIKEVMILLPFTTGALVIQTLNAFLNPFILKMYDIKWQTVINLCSLGVYFIAALVLWHFYGIIGFCVGTIAGHLVKTLIMLMVHLLDSRFQKMKKK